jgi:hypothetical protein
MPLEVDYLPVATGVGNNADTQANFAGAAYQTTGVTAGIILSKWMSKMWRQSSMIGAAIANFISATLNINVLDDGNLTTLIANFTAAVKAAASPIQSVNTTPVSVNANVTTFQNLQSAASPIVAGSLNVLNKIIRINAHGTVTTHVGALPISFNLNIGGASGSCAGFQNDNTTNASDWSIELIGVVTATGATGTIAFTARFMSSDPSAATTGLPAAGAMHFTVTVNLTAALTPQFAIAFPTSPSASNVGEQDLLLVEQPN